MANFSNEQFKKICAFFLVVIPLLFGIAGAIHGSHVLGTWLHFSDAQFDYLYGIAILIALLMVVLFAVVLLAAYSLRKIQHKRNTRFSDILFEESPIASVSIAEIARIDIQSFPHEETSEQEFQDLYAKNNTFLRCWRYKSNNQIAGFFLFSSLSEKATNNLLNGTYRCASDIPDKFHLKTFRQAHSLYIHDILGNHKPGLLSIRGMILRRLIQEIQQICANNRNISHIFCRPVTDDGRRASGKLGFQPIKYPTLGKQVWYLDTIQLNK